MQQTCTLKMLSCMRVQPEKIIIVIYCNGEGGSPLYFVLNTTANYVSALTEGQIIRALLQ